MPGNKGFEAVRVSISSNIYIIRHLSMALTCKLLLAERNRHYVSYDGNGNVMALLDAESVAIAGRYEYDPFGKEISTDQDTRPNISFRFSSKFVDDEAGLVYYGYRFFSSHIQRWLGRDPLVEEGGVNLFAFCRNNAIDRFDLLGQVTAPIGCGCFQDRVFEVLEEEAPHNLDDCLNLCDRILGGRKCYCCCWAAFPPTPRVDSSILKQAYVDYQHSIGNSDYTWTQGLEVDHNRALADGGSNVVPDNVGPITHANHVAKHQANGG